MNNANKTNLIGNLEIFADGSGANAIGKYRGITFACKTVGGHVRLYRLDSNRASRRELIIATSMIEKAYQEARDSAVSADWMQMNRDMYPEAV